MAKPRKLHHPVAVCTRCRVYSYEIDDANQPCFEKYGGKPCPGTFASAVAVGDWDHCPHCEGVGSSLIGSCDACQGSGWIFVRDPFP
jgi:hypothetical protein